jgi:hypothetical protein
MVGRGHPTLADTLNTPLRAVLSQSGYDPDATNVMLPSFSKTVNAGSNAFSGTAEARITAAIALATLLGWANVYIPILAWDGIALLPYNASLVTFSTAVKLFREAANLREFDVQAYGAAGTNTQDDTAGFVAALLGAGAQQAAVFVPDPTVGYKLTAELTIPTNTGMFGIGKHSTRLIHSYNGQMFNLGFGARMENLYLDGNGGSFTGRGCEMFAGNGKQTVRSCKIIDFADYCVDFTHEAAGAQSLWDDCEIAQLVGTSVGQEAVIIRGTVTSLANARTFIGIETQGKAFIDIGPCNNLFLTSCRMDGLKWSVDSKGVSIVGGRIGSTITTMTILGANHTIDGCHIGPNIVIGAATSGLGLGDGNSYDGTITDSSGVASNMISHPRVSYTPTFATSGTAPVLGNGTLTGSYIRQGGEITYNIELTTGSTTTFGTGELRFGLPVLRATADVLEGAGWIGDDSGTRYVGVGQIPNAVQYVRLMRDTSGLVSGTSPVTWGTGDIIRITGSYYL